MSTRAADLRRLAGIYDASYPPDILIPSTDPHINTLVPNTGSAAAGAILVTVNGANFTVASVVEINQAAQTTTFVSATVLTVSFDPATAGTVTFTVRDGLEESNSVPFVVAAVTARDVSEWTIDDVKAFVVAHPDLLSEVEGFEQRGKGRVTLLEWLRELLDEENDPDAEAEVGGELMAYAAIEELAEALEVRVTTENTPLLQACLDAAAGEIDHELADGVEILDPPQALIARTNVNRAVEWFKAPAAYNGGVGFDQTGAIPSPPSGFERHAAALLPLKTSWGLA